MSLTPDELEGYRIGVNRGSQATPADVHKLLDQIDHLRGEVALLKEEIRLREESQIPVIPLGAQRKIERLEAQVEALREAGEGLYEDMRANVGDAYNLLTQGESPTQLRGPSAQRIYDRSKAAQDNWRKVSGAGGALPREETPGLQGADPAPENPS